MKSVVIFIFSALLLFSSCVHLPGISIVKREYRKGYYFNVNSGNINREKLRNTNEYRQDINWEPSDIPLKVLPEENTIMLLPEVSVSRNNSLINKSDEDSLSKIKYGENKHSASAVKRNYNFFKILPSQKSVVRENMAAVVHEGGELIWTIVAILILLWVLSLVTGGWGLGGLIYILLIVAVILALLRLLDLL